MIPRKVRVIVGPSVFFLCNWNAQIFTELSCGMQGLHAGGEPGGPMRRKSARKCRDSSWPFEWMIHMRPSAKTEKILGAECRPNGRVQSM